MAAGILLGGAGLALMAALVSVDGGYLAILPGMLAMGLGMGLTQTPRCAAIAGPANDQLDAPATADLLHQHGILWAPDIIVSAGGIIHATAVELHRETSARVHGIADTLTDILRIAHAIGSTPPPPAPAPATRSSTAAADSEADVPRHRALRTGPARPCLHRFTSIGVTRRQ